MQMPLIRFVQLVYAASLLTFSNSAVQAASSIVPSSAAERTELLRRAIVWSPKTIENVDIMSGPDGGFAFVSTVHCTFVEPDRANPPNGKSPKFSCIDAQGEKHKVKYGLNNGEVYGEVAASRILWALGFGADRNYPVRVVCKNCPADPWIYTEDFLAGNIDWEISQDNP